jgi:dipeptidyl-peptidase-4
MKTTILIGLAATFCFNLTAQAQLKRLSQQQTLGNQTSLTKPLPMVMGWSDDNRYIEANPGDRELYAIDPKSGAKTPYTRPPKK